MVEVIVFSFGVACTLFVQAAIVAWRLSYVAAKEKPVDTVDAENVVRIQRWKERRHETDKTFGRWA